MEMSQWGNWIIEEQYISLHSINITPSTVYGCISRLKETEETNNFQYKYTLYDQDHIWWISMFYYNYTTTKHNFWSWNKTAYMTMKR